LQLLTGIENRNKSLLRSAFPDKVGPNLCLERLMC